jgi:predicted permease
MLNTWLSLFSRIAGVFGRRSAEREFDDEIAAHLDLLTEDYIRRGMSPTEARLAARRSFGGVAQVKETQRELRGLPQIEVLWADTRFSMRTLAKTPGFTLVAVLTLALGIGVSTTVFSAFNAVALKPLPVADPGSVVRLERWFESRSLGNGQYAFSYPEYLYFRDHCGAFAQLVASNWPFPVEAGEQRFLAQTVSGNYFASLGIRAVLGRTFFADEDGAPGAHAVLVLSHAFWERQYHSDPFALGKTLRLNGVVFTILGVAPESFPGTAVPPEPIDFWAPIAMQTELTRGYDWRDDANNRQFVLLARLSTTASLKSAQAEAAVLMRQFAASHIERDRTAGLTLQRPTYLGNTEDPRFLAAVTKLMLVIGLVWLIACANLANMLLARAAARQREIAVRLALGANRGRIVRQLLTESTLLALAGGAAGLLVSAWTARLVWPEIQQGLLGRSEGLLGRSVSFPLFSLTPDLRVFAYTLVLALTTGIVFGLSPALQFTRPDITRGLKLEGSAFGARLTRPRFRSFLVLGQVAASMFLLATAGLLLRGLLRSYAAQPGFDARGVYLVYADFGSDPRQAAARQQRFYQRLQSLPELRNVAIGGAPMTGTWTPPIFTESTSGRTLASYASPDYFATLSIPLVRGRDFTAADRKHGTAVAVISERAARRLWPDEDPVGKRFKLDMNFRGKLAEFEVIGVAGDVRYANLSRIDPAHVYLNYDAADLEPILVKTGGSLAAVRKAVLAADPDLARSAGVVRIEDGPLQVQRALAGTYAEFAALLAMLAVTLAGIGIYGVMSYLVNCRIKEIGVLMALGADAGHVLRSVILQGLRPVIAGSILGLLGAGVLSAVLHSSLSFPGSADLLYGLPWWDPITFGGVTIFLATIAVLASTVPARRALRVDPMVALRWE